MHAVGGIGDEQDGSVREPAARFAQHAEQAGGAEDDRALAGARRLDDRFVVEGYAWPGGFIRLASDACARVEVRHPLRHPRKRASRDDRRHRFIHIFEVAFECARFELDAASAQRRTE